MAKRKANHMNSSISIRSVARRTFATYASQASVLRSAVAGASGIRYLSSIVD